MKLQHATERPFGFSMTNLMAIVAIIAFAGGCSYAHFNQEKARAKDLCCNCNLAQVGLAFRMWSDDNKGYPMRVSTKNRGSLEYAANGNAFRHFQCVSNELLDTKLLICPAENQIPAANFNELRNENLSYFVDLDADETMPQMFLAGDRNLMTNGTQVRPGLAVVKSADLIGWTTEKHDGRSYVLFVDGSVQRYSSSSLQEALRHTGTNAFRLAVP